MIKVNLANRKQLGVSSEVKSQKSPQFQILNNANLDQIKALPFKKVIAPALIGLLASYGLDSYKQDEIDKAIAVLENINKKNKKLQENLNKFKSYESIKSSLDSDEKTVKIKLETIKKLISDRPIPIQIMIAISNAIPKEVWISEFTMKEDKIDIKGHSIGLTSISEFMKNSREVSYFSSIEIVDTQQEVSHSGSDLSNYQLLIKRR